MRVHVHLRPRRLPFRPPAEPTTALGAKVDGSDPGLQGLVRPGDAVEATDERLGIAVVTSGRSLACDRVAGIHPQRWFTGGPRGSSCGIREEAKAEADRARELLRQLLKN